MLAVDRRAARYTWTVAVVLLLLYLVYVVRKTIFIFVLSLLFAYLLYPLVDLIERLLPASRTRTPALALAYVLFIAVLVIAGVHIGSRVVDQAHTLASQFPALLEKWQQPSAAVTPGVNSLKAQIIERIQDQIRSGVSHIIASLPQAGMKALTIAGDLVYVVVIPVLAFFFIKDVRAIREYLLDAIPEGPRRLLAEDLMADIHLLLAHYIRVLVILSVATFVAYTLCFVILGVPYTVLLSVLAAMLEFIPMIGPLTAAVVITLVAAVSGVNVLPVLIFMGVYRLFQDYVLSPHIMGAGVEMHPLAVLFGVFAGAEIAGIPGAFLSVPVIALLRIVFRRVRKAHAAAKLEPAAQT